MNMRKIIAPLLFSILAIAGCENNDLLQSEDKLNEKINGHWKRVKASSEDTREHWKFDNGTLTITKESSDPDTTLVDHGKYSITSKFSKSYVTISELTLDFADTKAADLNRQWTLAELSGTVLYISTTNQSGSIISREFIKE
jgi:hypothetical protein